MTDSDKSVSPQPPGILVTALERILRPVIRLLLHHQFTYPQFIALLKKIYVDVAETEMAIGSKRQSDSRIHLLTGVHRKDVKRLRAEPDSADVSSGSVSAGAQLVGQWMGNAKFLDDEGKPVALPMRSEDDNAPSFEQLVALVHKQDIRPRVILDEWLRLGVVQMAGDQIQLNTGAFTPDSGFEEKTFFFAKNLHDHASASASNLMGLKPSYFDRSVYYDQLSEESVKALGQLANQLGMEALTRMNKEALARQSADAGSEQARYRINFGIFHFDTTERTSQSDG